MLQKIQVNCPLQSNLAAAAPSSDVSEYRTQSMQQSYIQGGTIPNLATYIAS